MPAQGQAHIRTCFLFDPAGTSNHVRREPAPAPDHPGPVRCLSTPPPGPGCRIGGYAQQHGSRTPHSDDSFDSFMIGWIWLIGFELIFSIVLVNVCRPSAASAPLSSRWRSAAPASTSWPPSTATCRPPNANWNKNWPPTPRITMKPLKNSRYHDPWHPEMNSIFVWNGFNFHLKWIGMDWM